MAAQCGGDESAVGAESQELWPGTKGCLGNGMAGLQAGMEGRVHVSDEGSVCVYISIYTCIYTYTHKAYGYI